MEEGKLYKYIIINKEDKEIVMKDSYRAIAEFINLIYTEDTISHTTVLRVFIYLKSLTKS